MEHALRLRARHTQQRRLQRCWCRDRSGHSGCHRTQLQAVWWVNRNLSSAKSLLNQFRKPHSISPVGHFFKSFFYLLRPNSWFEERRTSNRGWRLRWRTSTIFWSSSPSLQRWCFEFRNFSFIDSGTPAIESRASSRVWPHHQQLQFQGPDVAERDAAPVADGDP